MIVNFFVYYFLVIIFCIICYDLLGLFSKSYNKSFNMLYVFTAIITALRYGTGMDTANYMVAYSYMPTIRNVNAITFFLFRFQPLYTLTNCLCKSITDDFTLMQILHVIVYYIPLYLLLKKLDLRKFYIFLIFFCYPYFVSGQSAMREGFALGFCFYALLYYFKNKWIPYYLLVTIGVGFHSGVILFYALPLIKLYSNKVQLNRKGLFLFVGFFALLSYAFFYAKTNLKISIGDNLISRYAMENNSLSITTVIRDILSLVLVYACCFKKKYEPYHDLIYLAVLYILIDLLAASVLGILYRFSAHLMIFFFFCVKIIFNEIKNKKNVLLGVVAALVLYYQPIERYVSLVTDDTTGPLLTYCSVISSSKDKAYFRTIILNSTATDYFE